MNDKYVNFAGVEEEPVIEVIPVVEPVMPVLDSLSLLEKSREETRDARLLAIEFFHRMYDDGGSGVNIARKYSDVMGWPWLVSGEVT